MATMTMARRLTGALLCVGGWIGVVTLAVAPVLAGPPASFAAPQSFGMGNNPFSVVIGDLNGDGKPDLATANYGDNTVSARLNTGNATTPTFAAEQRFNVGNVPTAVALADLNGDGKLDLIAANSGAVTVSVLLNTTAMGVTTPSFASQQSFAAGASPYAVMVGDFNGDGKPDLATGNNGGASLSVLLNTTTTGATTVTFTPAQTYDVGSNPRSVAVGDFNGDGKPDLVAANSRSNTLSVRLNTTAMNAMTASFGPEYTFSVGTNPYAVAVGDFNGDGKPDLAIANSGDNTASVLLNTTAMNATMPTFATQQSFGVGGSPYAVAVADFNGDGRLDFVTANNGDGSLSVLLNTTAANAATPAFAPQQVLMTTSHPRSVAVSDFNGDGKPDIADADALLNNVDVLLNATVSYQLVVNTTGDGTADPNRCLTGNANTCRLRDAVAANEDGAAGGTIIFAADSAITLASTLTLSKNVTIDGAGHTITLNGGGPSSDFAVVTIRNGASVTLNTLTIANGHTSGEGGGVSNIASTVILTNSAVTGNSADGGGGISNHSGSVMTLTNVTISGNTAATDGGGIENGAMLTVTNSTISGNTVNNAGGNGGGIANSVSGSFSITSTLLAANSATNGADYDDAGGGTAVTDNGYNLVQSASGYTFNHTGDIAGVAPHLGVLGNFGGPTQTIPLLPDSPAIEAGSCTAGSTDQRGVARVGGCDIGAYEYQPVTPTVTTTTVPASSALSLAGTGFQTGMIVTIGSGTPITVPATAVNDAGTSVALATPAQVAGTTTLTLTNPGTGHTLTVPFVITPVLGVLSATGGPTTGGQTLVLAGFGFGADLTKITVHIGDASGPTATVTGATNTQLTLTMPAHIAGTVNIIVTVNGQATTLAGKYTYGVINAAPTTPKPAAAPSGMPTPAGASRPTANPISGGTVNPGGTRR